MFIVTGIGLAMACAIKVKSTEVVLNLDILNTIDKGYSVIITLPDKMSLVRFVLYHCTTLLTMKTGERSNSACARRRSCAHTNRGGLGFSR